MCTLLDVADNAEAVTRQSADGEGVLYEHIDEGSHLGFGFVGLYVVFRQEQADDGGRVLTVLQGLQDEGTGLVFLRLAQLERRPSRARIYGKTKNR